jgi:hypothetical protein
MMLTLCSEKEEYEDLYLWMDDYRFQVSVDDYFLKYNDLVENPLPEDEDVCILAFVNEVYSTYWLVGDAFLKGYYSIHDNDDHANARIGFAPHATSTKKKVEKAEMPTIDIRDILWELTWLGSWADPSSMFSIFIRIPAQWWVNIFGI